jgi:hypothetical protein
MSRFAGYFTGILAGTVRLAGRLGFTAMAQGAPPDFAPDASIGWYAYNRLFIPPASGAGPVLQDPSRPYVSNDEFRETVTALGLSVGKLGNVRTETLCAFDKTGMEAILKKVV